MEEIFENHNDITEIRYILDKKDTVLPYGVTIYHGDSDIAHGWGSSWLDAEQDALRGVE